MTFITMLYFLVRKTDRIMLGMLRDANDVGIYNATANIASQLTVIHAALVSIFAPVIADVYNKGQLVEMKNLYNTVKRWSSYGTFFLFLPIIFYPKTIMLAYGGEFAEGWQVLLIFPAAYLVATIVGPTGTLLQMTGKQNFEFLSGSLMLTVNVVLNYLLIPVYGYFGAAMASALSMFIMSILRVCLIYRFFGFHPFDLKHIGFVGIACVIFAFGVAANVFVIPISITFLSLLIGILLLLIFGYKSCTSQDKLIWKVIKLRLTEKRS